MNQYKLTPWQERYLSRAKALVPGKPPNPWKNTKSVSAAGIFAGGWTEKENFVMLSADGYSEHNPVSGEEELVIFDLDRDIDDTVDKHNRYFTLPSTSEVVNIFGVVSGDGIYVSDEWTLEIIYPWWPNATVILRNGTDDMYALDLGVCDPWNWLKCGFAPSGESFVIIGHSGAELFSRA